MGKSSIANAKAQPKHTLSFKFELYQAYLKLNQIYLMFIKEKQCIFIFFQILAKFVFFIFMANRKDTEKGNMYTKNILFQS